MDRLPVEVVIVAYGPVAFLKDALEALDGRFQVRVVDNGLSDEAQELAAVHDVDYVRPLGNVGFAAAVNMGFRRCTPGADVLLLNPDAHIDAEGVAALQSARERAHDRVAAVAPRLVRPTGEVEQTTWPMPTPTASWRGFLGSGTFSPGACRFLSGAVLLISGQALLDVGDFDDRFFLYCEETDWQKRAQARGWSVLEASNVSAQHMGAATSSDSHVRLQLFHASAELFIRKWHGKPGWTVYRAGALVSAARRLITARGKSARVDAFQTLVLYLRGPVSQTPNFARKGG